MYKRQRPVTTPLEKTDVPTIYISLGTVVNQRPDFYKACISALGNRPYRVIMSVGEHTALSALGTLPQNIHAVQHTDQMAALMVSDVFVTHCGMNSVNAVSYTHLDVYKRQVSLLTEEL